MRALACALGVLLIACPSTDVKQGYQLQCNAGCGTDSDCPNGYHCQSGTCTNGDQTTGTSSGGGCPIDMQCQSGCCVHAGETPSCQRYPTLSQDNASRVGIACSAGCLDGGCSADPCSAANAGTCFSEAQYGLPGGACTFSTGSGSNCQGSSRQILPTSSQDPSPASLCLQGCESQNCREGWRCDCQSSGCSNCSDPNACACVPDCGSAPDSCGPGRTIHGSRCNAATGFCYTASDCVSQGASCSAESECCPGSYCPLSPDAGVLDSLCEPCQTCGGACCPSGSECSSGACCRSQGQSCQSPSDCCPGSACFAGTCQPCTSCGSECCAYSRQCQGGACCSGQYQPCASASDCCAGLTCSNAVNGQPTGSCEPCATCGESCCPSERQCLAGTCCSASGQQCMQRSDCCDGYGCQRPSGSSDPGYCQPCSPCGSACCTSGFQCVADAGACCATAGMSCSAPGDCCAGSTCVGGTCQTCTACGGDCCVGDKQCVKNLCCFSDYHLCTASSDCCAGLSCCGGACRAGACP